MAQINGCLFCKDWRTESDGQTVGDDFPGFVEDWAGDGGAHLSARPHRRRSTPNGSPSTTTASTTLRGPASVPSSLMPNSSA